MVKNSYGKIMLLMLFFVFTRAAQLQRPRVSGFNVRDLFIKNKNCSKFKQILLACATRLLTAGKSSYLLYSEDNLSEISDCLMIISY